MGKQSHQSWFLDTSPPSPQVASLLNIASFLYLLALVSCVLACQWQATDHEFGNNNNPREFLVRLINYIYSCLACYLAHRKYF